MSTPSQATWREVPQIALVTMEAAVEADDNRKEAEDVGHVGGREHEVQRRQDEGEGAQGGIALLNADEHKGALQEEGSEHRNEHGAHADRGEREAE
jgi:hypothetical protein